MSAKRAAPRACSGRAVARASACRRSIGMYRLGVSIATAPGEADHVHLGRYAALEFGQTRSGTRIDETWFATSVAGESGARARSADRCDRLGGALDEHERAAPRRQAV